jgi:ribosomal protein S30
VYRFVVRGPIAPCTGLGSPPMNAKGAPTRAGEVRRQTGAVATAVKTDKGLRWEVRRERDGLVRVTTRLAHTSHWHRS